MRLIASSARLVIDSVLKAQPTSDFDRPPRGLFQAAATIGDPEDNVVHHYRADDEQDRFEKFVKLPMLHCAKKISLFEVVKAKILQTNLITCVR